MWSAFAIMSAVYHRERQGEGQQIDISMMDAQVAWLTYQAAYFFADERRAPLSGVVAGAWNFYLNHIGPVIAQHQGAERTRQSPGQIENSNPFQCLHAAKTESI